MDETAALIERALDWREFGRGVAVSGFAVTAWHTPDRGRQCCTHECTGPIYKSGVEISLLKGSRPTMNQIR
jgi:hypothetical protein